MRTLVKFLSHEQSIEREEAVSLLLELSKSEALCEKIGSVNGAILILVGMTSSKSENLSTVEKADKTLGNLEKCENNVRQMAENGRLQPLLNLILEGTSSYLNICTMIFQCHENIMVVLINNLYYSCKNPLSDSCKKHRNCNIFCTFLSFILYEVHLMFAHCYSTYLCVCFIWALGFLLRKI